jgi:hypothetical protein
MKMTDLLDKDKSNLITELSNAAIPEKAIKVLENETDKLVLRFNEQCDSERERETAAYLMQAVRLSLPLIDSTGTTKVWEHDKEPKKAKSSSDRISVPAALLMFAGIVLCLYAMFPMIIAGMEASEPATTRELVIRMLAVFGGLAAGILGGLMVRRGPVRTAKEQQVEIHVDADKLYRYYRTTILSVDQSLDEVGARERWDKREQAGNIDGRPATTPELDLFSDLLAASYSGDPEYALEKIEAIKYYLHRQQIEVVDYSESTRQYFDMMPGTKTGTIRPAMVADGNLLKKGLASTRK